MTPLAIHELEREDLDHYIMSSNCRSSKDIAALQLTKEDLIATISQLAQDIADLAQGVKDRRLGHIYIYIYIYTFVCVCIYIYIYIYIK